MKKRKLLNYCGLATALIILLASCEKNDGEIILSSTDMAELSSVTNQSLDITFETTTTWKARCTANWLTFSPKSGEAGRNTITISTTSTNRTKSKRTAQNVWTHEGLQQSEKREIAERAQHNSELHVFHVLQLAGRNDPE